MKVTPDCDAVWALATPIYNPLMKRKIIMYKTCTYLYFKKRTQMEALVTCDP